MVVMRMKATRMAATIIVIIVGTNIASTIMAIMATALSGKT